jgi:drug/metabolite transporter (DMT)-like permease
VLAHIFLKEKLKKKEYFAVAVVLLGIIILGISEGINS